MTRRRKSLLVVLAVLVLGAGGFTWYWQATAQQRRLRALLAEARYEPLSGVSQLLVNLGLMAAPDYERPPYELSDELVALGPSVTSELIEWLEDDVERVRIVAAWALGMMKDRTAVVPLVRLLADESSSVRWVAAMALGKLGDIRAVEPLIALLQDERPFVRRGVAHALGRLGDPRALEPLAELKKDEDEDVRKAAKEALEKLRGKREGTP